MKNVVEKAIAANAMKTVYKRELPIDLIGFSSN